MVSVCSSCGNKKRNRVSHLCKKCREFEPGIQDNRAIPTIMIKEYDVNYDESGKKIYRSGIEKYKFLSYR